MNKLTRKLFISMMTVAFAVITLGATTFAWFTLSNVSEVQRFQAQVSAGTGIEISLDYTNFYSTITTTQIEDYIGGIALTNVTTADGKTFKDLQGTTVTQGYIQFPLYFRSPEPNVNIYLLNTTNTDSNGVNWTADVNFTNADGTPVNAGTPATYYAANSMRLAFVQSTFSLENGTKTAEGTSTVFELNPEDSDSTVFNNTLLQSTIQNNGAIDYYYQKTNVDLSASTPTLPTVLLDSDLALPANLSNGGTLTNSILKLTNEKAIGGQTYYYGMVMARVWLEGWDPDCFNAVLKDTIFTNLLFGGALPTLSVTPSSVDLSLAGTKTYDIDPVIGQSDGSVTASFSSSDDLIATVDPATGIVTAVGVGTVTITVTLNGYENVTTTFTVNVGA